MYIRTVKATTLKFFSLLLVGGVLFFACAVMTVPAVIEAAASEESIYRYDGVKTEEGRRVFLRQFGWETAEGEVESVEFTLPEEFDRILLGYNEIQREQGLDLSRYKKKKVTRYTYTVLNYGTEEKVYANLIVYRGRVIGGDISSAEPGGFVQGFEKKQ